MCSRERFEDTLRKMGPSILPTSHSCHKRSDSLRESSRKRRSTWKSTKTWKHRHFNSIDILKFNYNSTIPFFRVASVSDKLLMANRDIRQICDQQWTVTVVDQVLRPFFNEVRKKRDKVVFKIIIFSQPIRNAFVLPSGNIFVYKGMLDFCENDDQLAVRIKSFLATKVLNPKFLKGGSRPWNGSLCDWS